MSPAITPPALQEAAKKSTSTWQADLQALFHHARDRFPDVLWELEIDDDGEKGRTGEEVWGHKGLSSSGGACLTTTCHTLYIDISDY
jgi:hypothetical protein